MKMAFTKSIKKTAAVCLFALLSVFLAIPAFSQDDAAPGDPPVSNSDFYVLQVPIEKIYSTPKGYLIEYRKNGLRMNSILLPIEWFTRTAATTEALKGEMVRLINGKFFPYMTIYYKDGKTDHVRVFIRDVNHRTWGSKLPPNVNIDEISNIEDIIIVR